MSSSFLGLMKCSAWHISVYGASMLLSELGGIAYTPWLSPLAVPGNVQRITVSVLAFRPKIRSNTEPVGLPIADGSIGRRKAARGFSIPTLNVLF